MKNINSLKKAFKDTFITPLGLTVPKKEDIAKSTFIVTAAIAVVGSAVASIDFLTAFVLNKLI